MFDRLSVVQIDSVQAVTRSHYLPFFSRLGPYPRSRLDSLLHEAPRMGVEYWAHEAAYVAPATVHAFHRRRAEWFIRDYGQRDPEHGADFVALMEALVVELAEGPGTARALADRVPHSLPEHDRDHWGWNPSRTKSALEALFRAGRIACSGRTPQFERVYALSAHTHPELPAPDLVWGTADDPDLGIRPGPGRIRPGVTGLEDDAVSLVRLAGPALGIGTVDCFADYFRLPQATTRRAIEALTQSGELQEVSVDGVRAWRWHEAVAPRAVRATALLAPFDPLVFNRRRIRWLFGFDYRIEIYTPADWRRYGYYVMPFLHDEALRARVDVRAVRDEGTLRAAVHMEPGEDCGAAVQQELRELAGWLGLSEVEVLPPGQIC
ncbi:hypothetical protein BSP109_02090 [Brevibacterium sp. Mu109]|nr:hypothetical protein BSP109_02090 [Brevibacterium sp. Mu109]